jgi:tripartite-type tricarboxylate transporter receptor subunit TctC
LYVPAATPRAIVRQLYTATFKDLSKPEVREKIASQGMDAAPSTSPEAFDKEVRAESPYWKKLVKDSGAKVE